MRLSDIMSSMDLAIWPQVALVIFLVVFAGVIYQVVAKSKSKDYQRAARLPLED